MHHSRILPAAERKASAAPHPDDAVIAWLTEQSLIDPSGGDVRDGLRQEMEARRFVQLMCEIKSAGRLRQLVTKLRAADLADFAGGVERIHAADLAAEDRKLQ